MPNEEPKDGTTPKLSPDEARIVIKAIEDIEREEAEAQERRRNNTQSDGDCHTTKESDD